MDLAHKGGVMSGPKEKRIVFVGICGYCSKEFIKISYFGPEPFNDNGTPLCRPRHTQMCSCNRGGIYLGIPMNCSFTVREHRMSHRHD